MSLDDYLEHARRDMLPKMRESAICLCLFSEPDPKLCLEIGAAILFDKPILVVVPKGRDIPLALRTIAHKIVEISSPPDTESQERISAAVAEMTEAAQFRGKKP